MDLNHRPPGYEPGGVTRLPYPAALAPDPSEGRVAQRLLSVGRAGTVTRQHERSGANASLSHRVISPLPPTDCAAVFWLPKANCPVPLDFYFICVRIKGAVASNPFPPSGKPASCRLQNSKEAFCESDTIPLKPNCQTISGFGPK